MPNHRCFCRRRAVQRSPRLLVFPHSFFPLSSLPREQGRSCIQVSIEESKLAGCRNLARSGLLQPLVSPSALSSVSHKYCLSWLYPSNSKFVMPVTPSKCCYSKLVSSHAIRSLSSGRGIFPLLCTIRLRKVLLRKRTSSCSH